MGRCLLPQILLKDLYITILRLLYIFNICEAVVMTVF